MALGTLLGSPGHGHRLLTALQPLAKGSGGGLLQNRDRILFGCFWSLHLR